MLARRGELQKLREVGGEGLRCAGGIIDRDSALAEGGQGETHGHAMVVIGVDGGALDVLGRGNHQIIFAFLYGGSHLAQFRA